MKESIQQKYYQWTRATIKAYRHANPLKSAREPHSGFFVGQLDLTIGWSLWFGWVIMILFCVITDTIIAPVRFVNSVLRQLV